MSITALATYGLPVVGLGFHLLGLKWEQEAERVGYPLKKGGEGQAERPAPHVNDPTGKTIQQIAAILFLAHTGIKAAQGNDYVLASACGVGTAGIFVGGLGKPSIERFAPETVIAGNKTLTPLIEYLVVSANLLNVVILCGPRDMKSGGFYESCAIGTAMGATLVLSGARIVFDPPKAG